MPHGATVIARGLFHWKVHYPKSRQQKFLLHMGPLLRWRISSQTEARGHELAGNGALALRRTIQRTISLDRS
jgi:hypothetical protein